MKLAFPTRYSFSDMDCFALRANDKTILLIFRSNTRQQKIHTSFPCRRTPILFPLPISRTSPIRISFAQFHNQGAGNRTLVRGLTTHNLVQLDEPLFNSGGRIRTYDFNLMRVVRTTRLLYTAILFYDSFSFSGENERTKDILPVH